MPSKIATISLAVVGTVAAFALYNTQNVPEQSTNFLQVDYLEGMFLNHVAKYDKSYASKDEYNYRLEVFKTNY